MGTVGLAASDKGATSRDSTNVWGFLGDPEGGCLEIFPHVLGISPKLGLPFW